MTARDVAKFTAGVALAAIFADAAVGHGLAWENDPYWTYWITKTFLIATVFGVGTAVLGTGIGQGAVITAVHTVVLTVYYWSFSPIGLPSSPEWLDVEHTWITGVPIHFAVIYIGYLLALWGWNRRAAVAEREAEARETPAVAALTALGAGVAIVIVAGGLSSLALGDFPGFTWFLVRLLVTVPFILAWRALAGAELVAAVVGGTLLAFVWATYAHFLGPSGLPDLPLRVLEASSPSATVAWMGYREVWLVSLSIHIVVMVAVLVAATRQRVRELAPAMLAAPILIAAAVGFASFVPDLNGGGRTARFSASGPVSVRTAPDVAPTTGTGQIHVTVTDVESRVTPLPPHDRLDVRATIRAGRRTFVIDRSRAMIEDPLGRHTTWWGVGFDVGHHGRSGIGSSDLPAIESRMAAFGVASVAVNGKPAGASVPIHVMTVDGEIPRVAFALDAGDHDLPLQNGIPMLRVTWSSINSEDAGSSGHGVRYAIGTFVLALLLTWLLALTSRQQRGVR